MKNKIVVICAVVGLLLLAPTASSVVVENPGELPDDWSYQAGTDILELWEHWVYGQGSVCTVITNNTTSTITLTVIKNIHNNDPNWLMVDFHNALMVPDGMGGWIPSGDCDGLCFTGPPGGPCGSPGPPGRNPNASSSLGWDNLEDPAKDTLDFFSPPGPPLAFCQWMTLTFQITVPPEMTFNLDQHPTWIPEPATICLLGFGGLALLRKRRA